MESYDKLIDQIFEFCKSEFDREKYNPEWFSTLYCRTYSDLKQWITTIIDNLENLTEYTIADNDKLLIINSVINKLVKYFNLHVL